MNVVGSESLGIGTDWSKPLQDALRTGGQTGMAVRSQTPGFDWVGWRPEDRYSRDAFTVGFEAWDFWPNITSALLRRGLSEHIVAKILGENFLRVFDAAQGAQA
jgi:membrane dipeptidase